MKKCTIKIIPNIWSVIHKSVATDHIVFSTTIVEAKTRGGALILFNKYIADNKWIYRAKLEDVEPLKVSTIEQ